MYLCCKYQAGTVTLSMDANFGLCRRKGAGKSVHPPLSGTEIFFEQSEVDNFVANYQSQVSSSTQVRMYVYKYIKLPLCVTCIIVYAMHIMMNNDTVPERAVLHCSGT